MRRGENLDNDQRSTLDSPSGHLRPVHNHEIGLHDIIVGKDHVERRVEYERMPRLKSSPGVSAEDACSCTDAPVTLPAPCAASRRGSHTAFHRPGFDGSRRTLSAPG